MKYEVILSYRILKMININNYNKIHILSIITKTHPNDIPCKKSQSHYYILSNQADVWGKGDFSICIKKSNYVR